MTKIHMGYSAPKELYEALKKASAETWRSISSIIVLLLEEQVTAYNQRGWTTLKPKGE